MTDSPVNTTHSTSGQHAEASTSGNNTQQTPTQTTSNVLPFEIYSDPDSDEESAVRVKTSPPAPPTPEGRRRFKERIKHITSPSMEPRRILGDYRRTTEMQLMLLREEILILQGNINDLVLRDDRAIDHKIVYDMCTERLTQLHAQEANWEKELRRVRYESLLN
ncbi:hypothetical protein BGX20_007029, partial [Mortierella sp. AD010]